MPQKSLAPIPPVTSIDSTVQYDDRSFNAAIHSLPKVIPETEVNPKDRELLVEAKITLVRKYPFIGFMIMSTAFFFTEEKRPAPDGTSQYVIGTAAAMVANGKPMVYINPEFFRQRNKEVRPAILAHEILHIFLEHIGRQREHAYYAPLWNVATDFVINGYLYNLQSPMIQIEPGWLHNPRFYGMSADAVYHILLKEGNNNPMRAAIAYGAGTEMQPGTNGKDGQRPLDGVSSETVNPQTRMANKQIVATSISQHNNIVGNDKQIGTGVNDLVRELEKLLDSKIPWTHILAEYITSTAKNRYAYNRINRRSEIGGILFPTLTGDHIKISFGVDTSGSMSNQDLADCVTELYAILNDFDSWELELVSCDTQVHIIGNFSSEEGDDFRSIKKDLIGGGGTDMNPIIEHVNELEDPPSVLVICTDGYIPPITAVKEIPVVIVLTKTGNDEFACNSVKVIRMDKDDA